MDGVFVIGTDTGVGKTSVCAGLLKLLQGSRQAVYWKPIQTNTIVAHDTSDVKMMTSFGDESFLEPVYRFAEPLSPRMAAKKWGKSIDIDAIGKVAEEARAKGKFIVAEGAGGLLLPVSDQHLQVDVIKRLKLPVIIVGIDRVGVINQALLTLNACRDHNVAVLGVILTKARGTFGNAESIVHFGKVDVLEELEPSEDVRTTVAKVGASQKLRALFRVPSLPG